MIADTADFEKLFPASDFDRKQYNFTKEEYATLMTYHAIKTQGEMAAQLIDRIINSICLPRVGLQSKEDMGSMYDSQQGTFTVYLPKHWCFSCKGKAGRFRYEDNFYCEACLALKRLKDEKADE